MGFYNENEDEYVHEIENILTKEQINEIIRLYN
jgi:hypothetical protein